ncbi:MAG TPA: hypothetical protein VFN41_09755, partial [Candidatus Limnocylindrales bacterium]|nr:hypothetical protein [Candidatus Limnocylindrales bacterium]
VAVVTPMTAGGAMVAVGHSATLRRPRCSGRMGLVHLVMLVVLHVVSMMPSLPPTAERVE